MTTSSVVVILRYEFDSHRRHHLFGVFDVFLHRFGTDIVILVFAGKERGLQVKAEKDFHI